jgi:alkylmercury lyase
MTGATLEATSKALVESLCREDDTLAIFCTRLLRLLAEGRPVSRAHLAAALEVSREAVDTALQQLPNLEFDGQGNIIGSGLSLLPTPHQFRVNGRTLHTWCALDSLLYPIVLGQRAYITSPCPVTGRTVRLTVTPDEVADLDPADTLVSLVAPEASAACADVRDAFCQHVHFFAGPEAGATWRTAHPETTLVSVEEAYAMARLLAQTRYRIGTSVGDDSPQS